MSQSSLKVACGIEGREVCTGMPKTTLYDVAAGGLLIKYVGSGLLIAKAPTVLCNGDLHDNVFIDATDLADSAERHTVCELQILKVDKNNPPGL